MPSARLAAVTTAHVRRAAKLIDPKEVRTWGVVVDGREYPVKQVLLEAANLVDIKAPPATPMDFISHTAVRKLRQLGLTVNYHG